MPDTTRAEVGSSLAPSRSTGKGEGGHGTKGAHFEKRSTRAQTRDELARPLTAWRAGVLALLILLLTVPLVLAARADAFIYWTAPSPFGFIGRATNNGQIVDPVTFWNTPLRGLAVDANHVYWSGSNPFIMRTDLDGEPFPSGLIPTQCCPNGIAVDAHHIYWADAGETPPAIGRANLDGTDVEPHFVPAAEGFLPEGVAVDGDHVYWTNLSDSFPPSIGRANLDGTGVNQNFIPLAEGLPLYLAVDANHIYWSSHFTASIGRANLNGTGVDPNFIQTAALSPEGVAVDADHIYWSNKGTIGRANLDGTGVDQDFVADGNQILGDAFAVAVDSRLPTDAAIELIMPKKGPKSHKRSEDFVVDVTNVGVPGQSLAFTASPSDVRALVMVNGSELGVVRPQNDEPHTFAPGDEARFRFKWTYDGLRRGDIVQHSVGLEVVADANIINNLFGFSERTAK